MNHLNSMRKSKLVSVCSTQPDALLGRCYEPLLVKGSSKSAQTKTHTWIPSFPENLMYYELYETSSCKSSNHLSLIVVGGDDNGQVQHDFTEYDQVTSVDFSNHLRSVAAAFHVICQLPNCKNVRFALDDTNIELSTTDAWLSMNGTSKAFTPSARVINLEIRGDAITEEKLATGFTRVDEILNYAKYCFPNLQIVKIKLSCPLLDTQNKYVQVIQEFLDVGLRGIGTLPKLVDHCTSIHGGVVRCEPCKPAAGHNGNGQIGNEEEPTSSSHDDGRGFTQSSGLHKELVRNEGVNPAIATPSEVKPYPFYNSEEKYFEKELPPAIPVPGTSSTCVPAGPALLTQSLQSTQNEVGTGTTPDKMIKRKNDTPGVATWTSEPPPKRQFSAIDISADENDNKTGVPQFPSNSTPPSNQPSPLIPSSSSPCSNDFNSGPSPSYGFLVHNSTSIPTTGTSSTASPLPPLKGSTYTEWEDSTDEEEQPSSRPTLDAKALNNIPVSIEEMKKIMNTVNANEKKAQQRSINKRHSSRPFIEGVHYYRRPKKTRNKKREDTYAH